MRWLRYRIYKRLLESNRCKASTITTSSVAVGSNTWYNQNTDDSDNLPQSTFVKLGTSTKYSHTFAYDEDKRLTSETSKVGSTSSTLSYTFDDDNNITSVTDGTYTAEYFYDDLKQLVRVNDQSVGITYAYTYDDRGNMLSSSEYTYTTVEDLTSLTPTKTDSYTYNEDGIRTSKTVNGVTTNYVIDNKLIKAEYTDTYSIVYWYDDKDSIVGFFYTDKTASNPTTQAYIYTKNAQGDVTGILNSSGTKVVSYSYDSWGNVLSITGSAATTIGTINPIRYRGYYLDNEIGYYYLQTRYYNPDWHRFINADDSQHIGETGNHLCINAFAYCENNPIYYIDITGESLTVVLVCAAVGAIVGGLAGYGLSRILKVPKGKRWKYVLGGAVIGAVIGGCIGYAVGASGSSGIVLWSGGGVNGAGGHAAKFAAKNGLKTLEMTKRGKFLTKMNSFVIKKLGEKNGYKFMKPFWEAASKQFVKSAKGKQVYVNVFISASQFRETSIFAMIEYEIVRSLGMKIIWHFVE